jgi:hypothetical protein
VDGLTLVHAAYDPLLRLTDSIDDDTGWAATRLPGWSVRDLVFHLAGDCQRALVALATPSEQPADTDEVSYWSHWQPNTDGAKAGLRGTRIIASAWSSVRGPADLHRETARAVLVAASRVAPTDVVQTQGHRLTVDALLRTLAVEAAVHHLDLGEVMPDPPDAAVLAEVRRVLDALLGAPAPAGWSAVEHVRKGTGREPLTDDDVAALGALAERFPLFG